MKIVYSKAEWCLLCMQQMEKLFLIKSDGYSSVIWLTHLLQRTYPRVFMFALRVYSWLSKVNQWFHSSRYAFFILENQPTSDLEIDLKMKNWKFEIENFLFWLTVAVMWQVAWSNTVIINDLEFDNKLSKACACIYGTMMQWRYSKMTASSKDALIRIWSESIIGRAIQVNGCFVHI